ncbi:MAG TPA: fumarylacetoacetase [Steroidobacteraceae bacterium]
MFELNETHDPQRRSWVDSANAPESDFPIQNLPFGVFCTRGTSAPRAGVAIGDQILDLRAVHEARLITGVAAQAAAAAVGPTLNELMRQPVPALAALRAQLSSLLHAEGAAGESIRGRASQFLVPQERSQMQLPAAIGDFTDFSSSFTHMAGMRQGAPPAAFFKFPIGYHGRSSSIRASGFPVVRPNGQWAAAATADLQFGREPRLDFELEFAAFVGRGNDLGEPVPIGRASDQLFGYCLLNDWSARGIQTPEMGGLGPFLGKSFVTTISPWVVTEEAMVPFHVARACRRSTEPGVPPHLDSPEDRRAGGLSVEVSAELQTADMKAAAVPPVRIVSTNLRHLYWTFAQMVAHQTSNGCNLQPGDLIASGTVSGPEPQGRACLAEINERGTKSLALAGRVQRTWLEDGDELTIRGRAVAAGYVSIGFGACRGRVEPAIAPCAPS